MHQPYIDILATMTTLVRDRHFLTYQGNDEGHEGKHPECTTFSYDIGGDRCCACVAKPLWWDENGVPRFFVHSPLLCPDVGASEIALILVACQNCAKEFQVQMSWDRMSVLGAAARAGVEMNVATVAEGVVKRSLSYQIGIAGGLGARGPHYGDPPHHDGCPAGNTMNVWDLRVLEFWRRLPRAPAGDATDTLGHYTRLRELEIALPDLIDPERVGPS